MLQKLKLSVLVVEQPHKQFEAIAAARGWTISESEHKSYSTLIERLKMPYGDKIYK